MLVLLLSLLATKYAAGVSYGQFNQQQPIRVVPQYVPASPPEIKPIDLTDDIYNSDFWVNPNSHIRYNFEQVRRDQPTQVENRHEAVGAYLYNRPKKTTSTPKLVPTYAPLQEYNDDEVSNSAPIPTTTVLPPRATDAAPHWQDVLTNEQPAFPQYPARFPIWTEQQNVPPQSLVMPTQPQDEPTKAPDMSTPAPYVSTERPQQTWNDPSPTHTRKTVRLPHAMPASQFVPTFPSHPASELSTPSWMNDAPIEQRSEPSQPTKGRGHSSRGNLKFNWTEAQPTEATPVISANPRVGPSAANPPPPVPTLSAWHGDNFGK